MGIFKLNGIDYMGGGGGGNTNYEELTQLEYDALTEEEKNNGTIYFITDTNSNQDDKFQPVIYSEEEREIGVWTDGKPLYEKTVTFTNVSRTGVIDLDLINVDNIFLYSGQYDQDLPLPYVHSEMGNGIGGFFDTDSNGKRIWNVRGGSYAPSVTGWMTVRYTKTTDSPGSGQWTPQGIPAVHYSTDEQIVGTWIDGSTLYEKTISFTTSATAGAYTQIPHGISNVDKLWVDTGNSFVIGATYTTFAVGYGVNNAQGGSLFQVLVTNERLDYIVGSAHTSCPAYVTLRYTKTTS